MQRSASQLPPQGQRPGAHASRKAHPAPTLALPQPLHAEQRFITHHGQRIALYLSKPPSKAGPFGQTPLLLRHSINAAPSAAEVRPLFEHCAALRPVLAIELPGFGSSDRKRIDYTPQLMRDCVVKALEHLRDIGLPGPVDLMAVSQSCEIAACVATEHPSACRSLAFISPTGFESRRLERYQNGRTRDKPWLRKPLQAGPWSQPLYRLQRYDAFTQKLKPA